MADLNSRVDSFISLLLDVSGRVRPVDLEAHAPSGAEELLRAYASAHSERDLVFEGDTLVVSYAPAAPVPAAASPEPIVAPVEPQAAEPAPFVFDASAIPEVRPEPEVVPMPEEPKASVPFDPDSLPQVEIIQPMEPVPVMPATAPEPIPVPVMPPIEAEPVPAPVPFTVPVVSESAPEPVPVPVTPPVEPTPVMPEIPAGPFSPSSVTIPPLDDSSFFEFGPTGGDQPADAEGGSEPELVIVPMGVDDDDDEPESVPEIVIPFDDSMSFDLPELPSIEISPAPDPFKLPDE